MKKLLGWSRVSREQISLFKGKLFTSTFPGIGKLFTSTFPGLGFRYSWMCAFFYGATLSLLFFCNISSTLTLLLFLFLNLCLRTKVLKEHAFGWWTAAVVCGK